MKRLFCITVAALASFAATVAFAATTIPPAMIGSSGSTAGQAIISTGSGAAPVWGAVPLTGITGTLAITNGGTGATTAANARTNLGLGTSAVVNTGTSGATVPLLSTANTWTLAQTFTVRPTFNGATPWDSSNLVFATPPAIGGTTPAAGAFTTLSATGLITPSASGIKGLTAGSGAASGSVGQTTSSSTTGTSVTTNVQLNCGSISLPAGNWLVFGNMTFNPSSVTSMGQFWAATSTTSATLGTDDSITYLAATFTVTSAVRIPVPPMPYSFSATTTVYFVGQATFSGGTMTCSGYPKAIRIS